MRRNKILISLFYCVLCVLSLTITTSCVNDYFVDETNYRLYIPEIHANGGIDRNYDIYIYNSATGKLVVSKHLKPGMYANDIFTKEGIIRFTLPGGHTYYSYCFTDVAGVTFDGTSTLATAHFVLEHDNDQANLLPVDRKEFAYCEPLEFMFDTLSRYLPVVLTVKTDTVKLVPYPARVALLFCIDRAGLETAIGMPLDGIGRVGFVAQGLDVAGGVVDEQSGDNITESGIAVATNFDGFVTTSRSDTDIEISYGMRCVRYTGTGNPFDLLGEYSDDKQFSLLDNDIELILEYFFFPTVENRMLRLRLTFFDGNNNVKGGFYVDLKENNNSVVTLAPNERRLFVIDRMLMLNLIEPDPWNPVIPGGGGDLQ